MLKLQKDLCRRKPHLSDFFCDSETATYAIAVVQSRAGVTPEVRGGVKTCLLPVLDLLNHDHHAPTMTSASRMLNMYDSEETVVFGMIADRVYQAGEEYYSNYGHTTALDCFSLYGFVPEKENVVSVASINALRQTYDPNVAVCTEEGTRMLPDGKPCESAVVKRSKTRALAHGMGCYSCISGRGRTCPDTMPVNQDGDFDPLALQCLRVLLLTEAEQRLAHWDNPDYRGPYSIANEVTTHKASMSMLEDHHTGVSLTDGLDDAALIGEESPGLGLRLIAKLRHVLRRSFAHAWAKVSAVVQALDQDTLLKANITICCPDPKNTSPTTTGTAR